MAEPSFASVVKLQSGWSTYVEKYDRVDGKGEDIPLLFIHGFFLTSQCWATILPHFPQYTRIAYDVTPHGRTPAPDGKITLAALSAQARDVLAHFGYRACIAVGHSGGTFVAQRLANDYPGTVRKMILLTPLRVPVSEFTLHEGPAILRTATMETIVDIHLQFLAKRNRDNAVLVKMVTDGVLEHADRRDRMVEFYEALGSYVFQGLGGVDEQTWLVEAAEDAIVGHDAVESVRVTLGLPTERVLHIPTGHYLMWEDPEPTVEAIKSILAH